MEEYDEQENMVEIEKSCLIRMAQATTAMQETSRTLEIVQVLEKYLLPKILYVIFYVLIRKGWLI